MRVSNVRLEPEVAIRTEEVEADKEEYGIPVAEEGLDVEEDEDAGEV